jgi:hypothetical protein
MHRQRRQTPPRVKNMLIISRIGSLIPIFLASDSINIDEIIAKLVFLNIKIYSFTIYL